MLNKVLVQGGRVGDILNILPIAYNAHLKGQRYGIAVFEEFKHVLEGVSYCDSIVVPGSINGTVDEIDRAVEEAKNLSGDVVVTMTYQPLKEGERREESFQKQQWVLAGAMSLWKDQPPLIFDKRSTEREAALLRGIPAKRKFILVATDGRSSPFPYGALVKELLRLKFKKQFDIIDLADFKAERIYDLLALYERAYCLVAIDSAPLHLSYAVKNLPVCALINDKPTLWHGSCWRPNHIFHCRYKDYPLRAVEMLEAIENIGEPGSMFPCVPDSPKMVHVWNRYEVTSQNESRHENAKETWREFYRVGAVVECPVEVGALGRDSKNSQIKDDRRVPFVKDVIRLGMMKASEDDFIYLTRCDTCLSTVSSSVVPGKGQPWYSHRMVNKTDFHSAVDVFAFTKRWWREHQNEYPDMLMGQDHYWHRTLLELFKKYGAVEVPNACYREGDK